ncbi:flagellar basal body-associated FliL family protein [Sphingosinicella soli]|uniref:Flagellar protein FliL n=1 Tax=Sphingosinicella soli TaxID=333708 RepID=A0A7W7B2I1_9SPHN|nr:flagellar basal body-associated FliL family protein [Sphingosinicella soli]MBB4632816.1 flagellar FliL protein [Sphingosinicella soli]
MSDTPAPAPKKKSGLVGKLIPVIGALVLLGGGAAGGWYATTSGLIGGGHGPKVDKNKPQLVERAEGGDAPTQTDADGDGHYETIYFEMKREFTANLTDPNRYIQVGLGVATNYDNRVIEAVEKNEPAIRSAILGVLGEQTADHVATVKGKEELQRRLRAGINKTLQDKTGFGGISHVYFTSFVIQ